MAYVTKAEIEAFSGLTISTAQQTILDTLISAIQSFIEKYCGGQYFSRRWFDDNDSEKTYYYNGNDFKRLPIDDLRTVVSVENFGTALEKDVDYVLLPLNAENDNVPYEAIELIQPENSFGNTNSRISQFNPFIFEQGQKSVKVVGKFGYSKIVPADIKLATLKIISAVLKENIDETTKQVKSESLGDYSVSYETVKEIAGNIGANDILDRYVKKPKMPQPEFKKLS